MIHISKIPEYPYGIHKYHRYPYISVTPLFYTPPQAGVWISYMSSLLIISCRRTLVTPLVKISVSCHSIVTNGVQISPHTNFSQMKCQYTSMCLVRSCCIGLCEMLMAALLSQYNLIGTCTSHHISLSKVCNHKHHIHHVP